MALPDPAAETLLIVAGFDLSREEDGRIVMIVEIEGGDRLRLAFSHQDFAALPLIASLLTAPDVNAVH